MISRLGLIISRVFAKVCPDPFVIAVLLLVATALAAFLFGTNPPKGASWGERALHIVDTLRFRDSKDGVPIPADQRLGIWKLLEFAMQMALVLVTGHALAVSRPVRALIHRLANLPGSCASGAALVGFAACFTGLINWGLGLIVGALLAREVGRSLTRRNIAVHYPLLAAAGYTALMIWHGGLSGSAPLSVTTAAGAAKVLPPDVVATLGPNAIPLTETIFAPFNLVISAGLLIGVPVLCALLAPRSRQDMIPMPRHMIEITNITHDHELLAAASTTPPTIPERLDRSPIIVWLLASFLVACVARFIQLEGLMRIGLNEINLCMLALGLLLHGSSRSYLAAVEEGAQACAGIILQFPLYAAIMALIIASGLATTIADGFANAASRETTPLLSFATACVINFFVPSGGGQWAVQGPIAMKLALTHDLPLGKMVMTVAYGDQITNMLQPFWALPLLAITGAKARDIVGYTAVLMTVGGAWVILMLLLM